MSAPALSYSLLGTRRRIAIVAGSMLALFTAAMDQTLVSTALPRIVGSLGGLALFPWVFTAFMVASTTVIPVVGKLTDMYGRKPFYMAGVAILVVGSALCGYSQNMEQLIAFRALQGFGAGTIMGITFVIVGDVFPPAERGKYVGLFSGVFAAASILGPLIGGALTDYVSWRWVFYVNLPLGAIALAVLAVGLPNLRPVARSQPLDRLGLALLPGVVVPLLLAFSWAGSRFPWESAPVIGLLTVAAAVCALFCWVETRAANPAIPLQLFRNQVFSVSTAVSFLTGVALFGAVSFIPLFVQGVLGATATNSGLITMPMTMAIALSSTVGGQAIARLGRYRAVCVLGLAAMTGAMFFFSRLGPESSRGDVTLDMVVLGVGLGLSLPVLTLAVQNSVPYTMLGIATTTVLFLRQVGGIMGVAILGSHMNASFDRRLSQALPPEAASLPPGILAQLHDPNFILSQERMAALQAQFQSLGERGSQLFGPVLEAARDSLALAIAEAFFIAFLLCLVSVAVGLFMREVPLRRAHLPEHKEAVPAEGDGLPPSVVH
ncbi:Multidrug resistance protein 3 [bacterium HR25]|jgi:EmrB/QacA subfamily drug resistance transporter|nr:Multidrug resistance protein 3 [bacterium HR25]